MPYIEEDFPTKEIDKIAWSESNVRKPVYHLHKWFARRVGSTFRALILGAFSEENPMKYYYVKNELKTKEGNAPIILDPFMGGGTTVVEGIRLGCRMIGIDSNPLAWFITKKELELFSRKDAEIQFEKIEKSVKERISYYYKTRCKKGHEADIMYVFWSKKVRCRNCNKDVLLCKSFITAKLKKSFVYQCPHCGKIFRDHHGSTECPQCRQRFNPHDGITTGKTYTCPHCHFRGDVLDAVQKEKVIPEHEMVAIEYYCSLCGRDYKNPDRTDVKLYAAAKRDFERRKDELLGKFIPDQEIPPGFNTNQMRNFNYRYWYQMFNERQLLCLSIILEEIVKVEDTNLREFFLITFSDSLNANNMFTTYNVSALKLEPLFGGHHFWPPLSPVEGNVWGTHYGRGSFENYYKKGLRSLEYREEPYEVEYREEVEYLGKRKVKRLIEDERIDGKFGDTFQDLLTGENTLLKCDTAENLHFIPDESVDCVVTDPPYYDNIMYSELSDFFYVWLRLGLKTEYPDEFGPSVTRKGREIVVNRTQRKDRDFYIEGMAAVFWEVFRVLRKDGLMAFVFQHKKTEAWTAVLEALLKAGFYVVAVYPTHGETPSGVRAHGLTYNSIIVCRKELKRVRETQLLSESEWRKRLDAEIDHLLSHHSGLEFEDALVVSMGEALKVYSQCYSIGTGSVSMGAVGDIVADSLLRHVLERVPDVDRISKVWAGILSRKRMISRDTLNKLTRHGGIEIGTFVEENLIGNEKGIMVRSPEERKNFIQKKVERGVPLTYIDAAHLLWITLEESGNPDGIVELILRTGLDRGRLEQYVSFLAESTNDVMWKKVETTLSLND